MDRRWIFGLAAGLAVVMAAAMGAGLPGQTARGAADTGPPAPVRSPESDGYLEKTTGVRNLLSLDLLHSCVRDGDDEGLLLDLRGIAALLDGSPIDPLRIRGRIYTGPYPLYGRQSRYDTYQFRRSAAVKDGVGLIGISGMENGPETSWVRTGLLVVRLEMWLQTEGADRDLGAYELLTRFVREGETYRRASSVVEGPFVTSVRSENPGRVVIALRTDLESEVTVELAADTAATQGARGDRPPDDTLLSRFVSARQTRHEVPLSGLEANRGYRYRVVMDGWTGEWYSFRSAPAKGSGSVRFAVAGDSREGPGGGARVLMGVNHLILEREMNHAWQKDAAFWLFGGDLFTGHTTVPDDYRTQIRAFKWAAGSFWHERPVYTVIGNHDHVLRAFEKPEGGRISLDRWPYASESTEALFTEELYNPDGDPVPSDPARPPYGETVFSFQYGPVFVIGFNNNYWYSSNSKTYGGSPEGWIFPEQMGWIAARLDQAERDPSILYVFLIGHEPVFPNGGHRGDAMWHGGNNDVRAGLWDESSGVVRRESKGIVEVRNEFIRLVTSHAKVAAVFGSDEHNFSALLVTAQVPVGDPARDDRDGDGVLCEEGEPCSPLADVTYPTWFLTSGGAGAPHYEAQAAPWNQWWEQRSEAAGAALPESERGFRFTALNHWILIEATEDRVSADVFSTGGDRIERIEDLMAAKKSAGSHAAPKR